MNSSEFFRMVITTALGFIGVAGLLGVFRKRMQWDSAERAGLWLALELGVMVMLFALLPYPISFAVTGATTDTTMNGSVNEALAWRLSSLALVLYLLVHMGLVSLQRREFGAQYPGLMQALLVASGLCLVVEFANVVWWGSLAGYAGGVLWLLALCGIQVIAFVCYDRLPAVLVNHAPPAPRAQVVDNAYERLRTDPAHRRMRGGVSANHPDPAPDRNTDPNAQPNRAGNWLGRPTNRFSDDSAVNRHRGTLPDPTVRRGIHRNRRPGDHRTGR
ncbi:MAG: hypothetical protein H7Y11_12870 [Armatimonadetes bacterium]|nr:hypothetical protein [Anaerolineae bacterium]